MGFWNKIYNGVVHVGAELFADDLIKTEEVEIAVKESLGDYKRIAEACKIFSLAVLVTSVAFAVLGILTAIIGIGFIILIPSSLIAYLSYNSFTISVNLQEVIEHPLDYINSPNIIKVWFKANNKSMKERLAEHPILKPQLETDLQKNSFYAHWMANLVFNSLKEHFENPPQNAKNKS